MNHVTLQTEGGQDISTATSPAEITPKKIEKTFTTTNPVSEKINFTIEANQFERHFRQKMVRHLH